MNHTITSEIPTVDGCPALNRMKVFVTQTGMDSLLEHVFRDRQGHPIDLSELTDTTPVLRWKELVAPAGPTNPIQEVQGQLAAPVVQFSLPTNRLQNAGIYELSFGLMKDEKLVRQDRGFLWLERSLFGQDPTGAAGPPTIQELRQVVMDTGAVDNLWLENIEFSDDQLASAVGRPIHYWNTVPPPIRPSLDTRNFPFQEAWVRAICGHLFEAAAHHYRRTHLPYNAGGVSIDDKNKEKPYAITGHQLLEEWKNWVSVKKLEINQQMCVGSIGSSYGGLFR